MEVHDDVCHFLELETFYKLRHNSYFRSLMYMVEAPVVNIAYNKQKLIVIVISHVKWFFFCDKKLI